MFDDETAALCQWHIAQLHPLEAWSDARAFDGTATIMQPLIAPLYDSARSAHEVLAALGSRPGQKTDDVVKDSGGPHLPGISDRRWNRALHDGVVADWTGPIGAAAAAP